MREQDVTNKGEHKFIISSNNISNDNNNLKTQNERCEAMIKTLLNIEETQMKEIENPMDGSNSTGKPRGFL